MRYPDFHFDLQFYLHGSQPSHSEFKVFKDMQFGGFTSTIGSVIA